MTESVFPSHSASHNQAHNKQWSDGQQPIISNWNT